MFEPHTPSSPENNVETFDLPMSTISNLVHLNYNKALLFTPKVIFLLESYVKDEGGGLCVCL